MEPEYPQEYEVTILVQVKKRHDWKIINDGEFAVRGPLDVLEGADIALSATSLYRLVVRQAARAENAEEPKEAPDA